MPPDGHGVERGRHDRASVVVAAVARVGAQQQLEAHRLRELRRAPEAAPRGVELRRSCCERAVQRRRAPGTAAARRCMRRRAAERLGELAGLLEQLVAPRRATRRRRRAAARRSEACHGALREVGAAEERPPVGREEHRHRPAAAAGHGLDRVHVDRVDVGALLAVDLDVDEQRRSSPRRPRRPRTTRAPSRGTSGTPSSRPRAGSGLSSAAARRSLVAPRVPVDRVVRVLAQVRGRLVGEAVHVRQAKSSSPASVAPPRILVGILLIHAGQSRRQGRARHRRVEGHRLGDREERSPRRARR